MFEFLTDRFQGIFAQLKAKGRLTEADVDRALRDVRLALLEADVNVAVIRAFLSRIRERALGAEVQKALTPGQQVIKTVHEELITTLGKDPVGLASVSSLTILLVGLQGSGKTTSAAKLARHLQAKGRRPLLVAADLRRPAAIHQLVALGERIGVPVYHEPVSRPEKLVRASLKEASRAGSNAVIVDTAGRHQVDQELMDELASLGKAVEPHETLLVVDAMSGQDAVNVASGFLRQVPLTGVVLTKLDGDARGGAAISVREVTGSPIKFVGTGEELDDFEAFHPDRMAGRILGMGDVLGLIEKAELIFDQEQAKRAAEKVRRAEFTLEDFLDQMQQLKQMGSITSLLAMLPGTGSLLRDVQIDDSDVRRVEAVIRSMTPEERINPKIIGSSRKRRIAAGSGSNPQTVNQLLRQFTEAQRMMKMLSKGGGLGVPGFPAERRPKPGTKMRPKTKR